MTARRCAASCSITWDNAGMMTSVNWTNGQRIIASHRVEKRSSEQDCDHHRCPFEVAVYEFSIRPLDVSQDTVFHHAFMSLFNIVTTLRENAAQDRLKFS